MTGGVLQSSVLPSQMKKTSVNKYHKNNAEITRRYKAQNTKVPGRLIQRIKEKRQRLWTARKRYQQSNALKDIPSREIQRVP
jgi:hypothetical protein